MAGLGRCPVCTEPFVEAQQPQPSRQRSADPSRRRSTDNNNNNNNSNNNAAGCGGALPGSADDNGGSRPKSTSHTVSAATSAGLTGSERADDACSPVSPSTPGDGRQVLALACCGAQLCRSCARAWLAARIEEGEIPARCPGDDCEQYVGLDDAAVLLEGDAALRYRRLTLLRTQPNTYTACPSCGELESRESPSETEMVCSSCAQDFCFEHSLAHQGTTCAEYRAAHDADAPVLGPDIKSCPNCGCPTQLREGCPHVRCPSCRVDWCFTCGNANLTGKHVRKCPSCNSQYIEHYLWPLMILLWLLLLPIWILYFAIMLVATVTCGVCIARQIGCREFLLEGLFYPCYCLASMVYEMTGCAGCRERARDRRAFRRRRRTQSSGRHSDYTSDIELA